MGKRTQIEAINGENQLPEPIIHRVQSFLTAKEAAQTAILSKSWCSAWSTRPNVDLDLFDFDSDGDVSDSDSEFKEFIKLDQCSRRRLFKEKIGATHLIAEQIDPYPIVVLTQEVFEAENLIELSVERCQINDTGLDRKVRCSKLESLSLDHVEINSAVISHIALCCPLIQKLSLYNLRSFTYDDDDDNSFNYLFLSDLSSKFPSLKDLTLRECKAQVVSSRTLERLIFSASRQPGLSVKFDVPSIRKFIFKGYGFFPSFTFVSVSREWESDVSFTHHRGGLSTSWFCGLNKFITLLSSSKIHLSLDINSGMNFDYVVGDIQGLTKPEVENLTISITGAEDFLSCHALFDGLFRICRPKVITQYLYSEPIFCGTKPNNDLLCKTLVRGLDEKCIYALQDLEEVNVHFFDEDVHSWRPLKLESVFGASTSAERWESFLDALVSPKGKREIRFQLKWKTQNRITL